MERPTISWGTGKVTLLNSIMTWSKGIDPVTLSFAAECESEQTLSCGGTFDYTGNFGTAKFTVISITLVSNTDTSYIYNLTAASAQNLYHSKKFEYFDSDPEGVDITGFITAIENYGDLSLVVGTSSLASAYSSTFGDKKHLPFIFFNGSIYDALMFLFNHTGWYPTTCLENLSTANNKIFFESASELSANPSNGKLISVSESPASKHGVYVYGNMHRKPVLNSKFSAASGNPAIQPSGAYSKPANFDYDFSLLRTELNSWAIDPKLDVASGIVQSTADSTSSITPVVVMYGSITQDQVCCSFNDPTDAPVDSNGNKIGCAKNVLTTTNLTDKIKMYDITNETDVNDDIIAAKAELSKESSDTAKNIHIIPYQVTNGNAVSDAFTMFLAVVTKQKISASSSEDFVDLDTNFVRLVVASALCEIEFKWVFDGYRVRFPYGVGSGDIRVENNLCSTLEQAQNFANTYSKLVELNTVKIYSGEGSSIFGYPTFAEYSRSCSSYSEKYDGYQFRVEVAYREA